MKKLRFFAGLVLGVFVIIFVAACGSAPTPAAEVEVPEPLAPDAFSITLDPIGHWHVFAEQTLRFAVQDTETSAGVAGLDLVVQIARAESDRITERTVANEQITDEGDGVYSLAYAPSSIGAYSLTASFVKENQHFASAPVVFEVARDGDEGIKVDAGGDTYVYQIRYNWDPGHIHANDEEPVKMIFELMRGIQVGDEINWEQPWRNTFNHLNTLENAFVEVLSEDGSVSDTLDLSYQGRGIYEAERVFPADEVGEGKDYAVSIAFTDPMNGGAVANPEPYPLHAVPGH